MDADHIFALWQSGNLTDAIYRVTVITPAGFDLAAFIERCERDLRSMAHDLADMKARSRCIDLMRECLTSAKNVVVLREVERALCA